MDDIHPHDGEGHIEFANPNFPAGAVGEHRAGSSPGWARQHRTGDVGARAIREKPQETCSTGNSRRSGEQQRSIGPLGFIQGR